MQTDNLEKAILGGLLLIPFISSDGKERNEIDEVFRILTASNFSDKRNKIIFDAYNVCRQSGAVDSVILTQFLKSIGKLIDAGNYSYIAGLPDFCENSYFLTKYANDLKKQTLQLSLSKILNDGTVITDEYIDKLKNTISHYENEIYEKNDFVTIHDEAKTTFAEIETKYETKNYMPTGLLSGYRGLDKIIYEFSSGDYIILAGRPGWGKTSLALNIAQNIACKNQFVAIFSIEMTKRMLFYRMLSQRTGLSVNTLRKADIKVSEWDRITEESQYLATLPIAINDSSNTIDSIRKNLHQYRDKIKFIIIDYLQLIKPMTMYRNKEAEISQISIAIKETAKEYKVPILAISQLNRNIESRGTDREPQLSDLRGSGEIEQNADFVLFLYSENNDENVKIIVSKNRNGVTGRCQLRFRKESTSFEEIK